MSDVAPLKMMVDLIIERYQNIESTLPLLARELGHTEKRALRLVALHGKITIGGIGHALGLPPSSTTWMVNNLVGRSIFHRERDKEDKRKTWITLGERGEALYGLMDRIPDRIAHDLLYKLEKDQRDEFIALVEAALARIEKIGAFK